MTRTEMVRLESLSSSEIRKIEGGRLDALLAPVEGEDGIYCPAAQRDSAKGTIPVSVEGHP